jgi:hypothetical protein
VAKWDTYEAKIDLSATYTNPYDYGDIAVQATFTSPSGRQSTVDAFWMQDYSIDPSNRNLASTGVPGFRVRLTPDEIGQWSYVLSCRLKGGTPTNSPSYNFTCSGTSSTGKGYIRKNATNYLKWDDGSQYVPVGENIAFPMANVVADYEYYLDKLEPKGVNFWRAWMANWGFGIEWTNSGGLVGFGGLKQYKQSAAKALDYFLDRGHTKGYAMMLCINYHNEFMLSNAEENGQWGDNPYNTVKGGPCTNPQDFFTNATAKATFKNRLRYMVARYGYAGSLQSWELFNEVENVHAYAANAAAIDQWHDEMAAYLKSIDPNHLVTTSFGLDTNGGGTWSSANIDFTQTHKYKLDPDLPRLLSNLNQGYLGSYHKPVMNGEFGLSFKGDAEVPNDPDGIGFHNTLWVTLFSGAMGSASPWWWDTWVDARNFYPHFSSLTSVRDVVDFQAGDYKKTTASVSGVNPVDATITPEGMWGVAPQDDFTLDAEGALTPGPSNLCQFIYGSQANTQYRKPPTFHVNYLQGGSFVVVTGAQISTASRVSIYVDGDLKLDQAAQTSSPYSVSVSAGPHTIKVDNLGGDWAMVSKYMFLNAVGPFNTYVLKSADSTKAAGYVLNSRYNWQYFQDHGNAAPPAVSGASLSVPGLQNGTYTVNFYSCAPAAAHTAAQPTSSVSANVTNGTLTFALPSVAWDVAFQAVKSTTSTPGALSNPVTFTPTVSWGAATAATFALDGSGTLTPGTSSLGYFVYGSQANTQYRNPPTFNVTYAQDGYFEVRTGSTISSGSPRVTISVDGAVKLDQAAFTSQSYVVTIPAGAHSIKVDNLGIDWFFVDHFSFVPKLDTPPTIPTETGEARALTPTVGWGTPPADTFVLDAAGNLTPGTDNLSMVVYGSEANTQYRKPSTFNVTFPQNGYFLLRTSPSISNGYPHVSIYVDGALWTEQLAYPNFPYVVTVPAGTHNIKVDNLGGDWFMTSRYVFDSF